MAYQQDPIQHKTPPARPRRLPRTAALMATCGLALGAALMVLAWWLGSPGSLAWALHLLQRQWPTGLQVHGTVTGSVSHGGTLERVEWSNDTHRASCTQVVLAWQWQSVVQGHLQLDQLAAARCDVTPTAASTPRVAPPTALALPLGVSAQVRIAQLVWHENATEGPAERGREWTLAPLHARYHYDHRHHQLSVTQLGWQQGRYTAQVEVSALADLTLVASLSGQLPPEVSAPARSGTRPALGLQADLQGSLRADAQPLTLNASITARPMPAGSATQHPQTAQVALAIAPWADWPIVQASVQVHNLNLAPLWPGLPTTGLSGQLHLTPSPTQWSARTQLTNTTPGPWNQARLPLDTLEANATGLPNTAWTLQSLQARYGAARLTASGRWHPGQALWHGDALASALEPARMDTRLAGPPLSFKAQARHTAQGVALSVAGGSSASPTGPAASPQRIGQGVRQPGAASPWTVHAARFNGLWTAQRLALHDIHLHINRLQVDGQLAVDRQPLALSGALELRHPGLQGTVQGQLSAHDGAGRVQLTTPDPAALHELLGALGPSWGLTPPALLLRLRGGAALTGAWHSGWKGSALGPLSTWQLSTPALTLQAPPATPGSGATGNPLTLSQAHMQWRIQPDHRVDVSSAAQWRQGPWSGSMRHQMQAQRLSDGSLHITWPQWDMSLQSGPRATPWRASLAQAWNMDLGQSGPTSELRHEAVQWQLFREGEPAALPLNLSAGRLTAEPQSGAWHWTHQGELPRLPLAWLKELPGADRALSELQGDLTLSAHWQLDASPGAWHAQARVGRLSGDVLVGTDLTTSASGTLPTAMVPARLSEFTATAQAQGRTLTAQIAWASERAGSAKGSWSTSLNPDGGWHWPLDAPIQGRLDAHLPQLGLWSKLAPPGWRVRGTLDSDLRVSGTRGHPVWSGTLTARELALRSAVEGVELGNGRLDARFQEDGLVIDRFEMQGPAVAGQAPGLLTAQGTASWRAAAATPSATGPLQGMARLTIDAKATAERLRISSRADRRMVVSGELSTRLAASRWTVRGTLKADSASIQLPDESTPTLGADVIRPGSGATPPPLEAHVASAATPASAPSPGGASAVDLALDIDLGPAFQLQGRGLSSTLAGQLRWTLADGPQQHTATRLHGDVQVRQGTFKAYGQLLDITRGTVRFTGLVDNPQLDIEAIRPGIAQRVGVAVTGPAQQPKVQLIADAEMGDAEKLSWLILGRAAAGGNAEAAVLQQAALALLGGSGGGLGGELSRAVGLDELSVSAGGTNGATVTLGKRLARNLYVAYERSLAGSLGTLYLFLDLTRSVTVRAQAGEQSAVDLIWTRRFD